MPDPVIGRINMSNFTVFTYRGPGAGYDQEILPVGSLISYEPETRIYTVLEGPFTSWQCQSGRQWFRPLSPLELLAREAK